MKKLTMSNLIEEVNTNLKQAIPESHLNTDLEEHDVLTSGRRKN